MQVCKHCCTKIEGLNVRLGNEEVLHNINLHLNCNELLSIIGPNGAGKTTLLRALLGEVHYSGKISFQIKGNPAQKPKFGYVPQKLNFSPDSPISVLDFMASAIKRNPVWLGVKSEIRKDIKSILSKFSSENLIDKRIGQLSGGELQRVLLAMAMIPTPDLLLLDEPVSAVDVKGLSLFYEIVTDLKNKYDISVIMATHDLAGIAPHADRMVLLNRSIIADGSPGDVFSHERMLEAFKLSLWNISSLLTKQKIKE